MNLNRCPVPLVLRIAALAALPLGFAQAQVINPTLLNSPQVSSVLVLPEGGALVLTDATHIDGEEVGDGISVRKLLESGELDPAWSFPQHVKAVGRDPMDGSIVVAGEFSYVNGPNGAEPRARLARYSAAGQLQAWSLQPDVGQEPLNNVSRVAFTGGGDLVFVDELGFSESRLCVGRAGASVYRCDHRIAGGVLVLEAQGDGSVLLGGAVTQLNGEPIPPLVRLLPETLGLDAAFSYTDTSSEVNAVAVQNGTVWVAAGSRLHRLLGDGSVDPSVSITANAGIRSLRADGGDGLIVGGAFSSIDGAQRQRLARLHTFGAVGVDPLWQAPAIMGGVRDIAVLSDRVLAVGPLDSMVAQAAGLIALNRTNGASAGSNRPPRLGRSAFPLFLVSAPTADGGAVFAGSFSQTSFGIVSGLLKVDSSGAEVAGWSPVLSERVITLLGGPDGFVYAGFERSITSSIRQYSLRRLSIEDGSLDENWQLPLGNNIPSGLTIDSDYLWLGYRPDAANVTSSRLGRVSLGATAVPDAAWNNTPEFLGLAAKIIPLPDGSALVLPGSLPSPGDLIFFPPPPPPPPGPRMYRLSPGDLGPSVQAFGPDLAGGLSDIVRQNDGRLLALEFTGSESATLRRFSASGELDADFNVDLSSPRATGSIALDEGRGLLYFSAATWDPGSPSTRLYRQARLLLASQTIDDSWPNEAEDPGVRARLTLTGSRLFAGASEVNSGQPAGAFMSTAAQPMFADGFENP